MPPLPTQSFNRVLELEVNIEWGNSSKPTTSPYAISVYFGVTNSNFSGPGPTGIGDFLMDIPYYQLNPVMIGSDPSAGGPLSFKETSTIRNQNIIRASSYAYLWLGLFSGIVDTVVTARKLWINFTVTDVRI